MKSHVSRYPEQASDYRRVTMRSLIDADALWDCWVVGAHPYRELVGA